MSISIAIVDEILGNKSGSKNSNKSRSKLNAYEQKERRWMLEFLDESVTAQEVIRRRIYQEVQDHNLKENDVFYGLVQPTGTETLLNGFKLKEKRTLDWEAQYTKALEAFEANGFIMLVNDQQIETLDEIIELKMVTQINFLRLIPLVGG